MSAARHGVVARAALRELGLSDGQIGRLKRDGTLWLVHRGVYAVGRPELTQHGRWLGAVLACGEGAVLSHVDAAALCDLRPRRGGPIHVSVPRRGTQRAPGLRIHVTRTLTADDVTEIDDIPCTSPERVVLDCADVLGLGALERLVETGYRGRAFRTPHLHRQIAVPGRRSRKVARALRAEPRSTRSPLEDRFLRLLEEAGGPTPLVNTWFPEHEFEVDVIFASLGLAVEIDSSFHDTPHARERDARKDRVLRSLGYRVERIREPDFPSFIHRLVQG